MKKENDAEIVNNQNRMLLYKTDNGAVIVDVIFEDDTFWLSQKSMAQLFGVKHNTIVHHIKEVYSSNELEENTTCRKIRQVQTEGNRKVTRETLFYNLKVIISVGYRVNSNMATDFRKWATETLDEFITKGYVLNVELLKNGRKFGKDYFDDLVEKITEIRASERRFYQKITDIYSQCSYDYTKNSDSTQTFFKTVQNKLHFSITGKTAPEIIVSRADSTKTHMGLTTWKNAPDGKIMKSDVSIAKNYLEEKEMFHLNEIVTMYLMYAENQARRHQLMSMKDWIARLDGFLQFNEYDILNNAGKVTAEVAKATAEAEYDKFRVIQDSEFVSDFDVAVTKMMLENDKGC